MRYFLIEVVGRVCPDTGAYIGEQQMVAPRAIHTFGCEIVKENLPPCNRRQNWYRDRYLRIGRRPLTRRILEKSHAPVSA